MGSQKDLDQGGTFREWVRTYLGPSVGWVYLPGSNILSVTTGGTTTVVEGTSLVIIDTTAAVTVKLPSALDPSVPAGALPGPYVKSIVTIVDIAGAPNCTIDPASGAETIMSLASIALATPYGSFSLRPDNTLKGWTAAQ